MDILEISKYINDLIDSSNGKKVLIDSDVEYTFMRIKGYQHSEIEIFEKKLQISLPQEYRDFLTKVGACKLYLDNYQASIIFHELEKINKLTEEVFVDLPSPFPQLLLIASNLNNGDLIGYNLNVENKHSLSIYSVAEAYPENWVDYDEFITLQAFLEKLICSDGEDYYL